MATIAPPLIRLTRSSWASCQVARRALTGRAENTSTAYRTWPTRSPGALVEAAAEFRDHGTFGYLDQATIGVQTALPAFKGD
jgi:hypothetical protein